MYRQDVLLEDNNRRRIQAIHILNRIGNCHDILGDYDSALEKFRASEDYVIDALRSIVGVFINKFLP